MLHSVIVKEGIDIDVLKLVGRLRQADKDELYATNGEDPDKTLIESWNDSKHRWSVWLNDYLVCVFGLTEYKPISNIGIPWLLGSDDVLKIRKTFVKQSISYIDLMLDEFQHLFNFVDARNKASIRWLKWLGFEFHDPQPFGFEKRPFMMFTKSRYKNV